jgi:hypothetical protein
MKRILNIGALEDDVIEAVAEPYSGAEHYPASPAPLSTYARPGLSEDEAYRAIINAFLSGAFVGGLVGLGVGALTGTWLANRNGGSS